MKLNAGFPAHYVIWHSGTEQGLKSKVETGHRRVEHSMRQYTPQKGRMLGITCRASWLTTETHYASTTITKWPARCITVPTHSLLLAKTSYSARGCIIAMLQSSNKLTYV